MGEEYQEIEDIIQNAIEDAFDDLEATIENSVEAAVQNAFQNMLSNLELVLPDGTHIVPRKKMRLTGPDKMKVLICYGGLSVEDTSKYSGSHYPAGWGLAIQTRVDSWELIYIYDSKEKAVSALEKVNKAINDGLDSFEL
ncbi:MAG: hypothetical protein KBS59_02095 [Clostridiales bacterium]|nr:hypothetical protein [Clostridiales bacterium]